MVTFRGGLLPSSSANTCILVVVDHFLKSCLISLKGLPTAMATSEYVFRYDGIPEDVMSDRAHSLNQESGKPSLNS